MDQILTAVDFTDDSNAAFAEALSLASRLGATLHVAHVVMPVPVSPAELVVQPPAGPRLDEVKAALAHLVDAATARGVKVESHLMVGEIVFGLLDLASRVGATLIVVGSHGKGLLRRALVGSVAAGLCRKSRVPVVVVPSRRRVDAVETARSCDRCGHILGDHEPTERCAGCGAHPASWLSAPIAPGPIDAGEPAVGEVDAETLGPERTQSSAGLFSVSPPGTEGYDVNPELRVRY